MSLVAEYRRVCIYIVRKAYIIFDELMKVMPHWDRCEPTNG